MFKKTIQTFGTLLVTGVFTLGSTVTIADVPIGTILPYGGDVKNSRVKAKLKREGWLVCNGEQLPEDDYKELYDVIRRQFGGDAKRMFNLPDLRGRFVRGVDDGVGRDPYASSRGESATGGSKGDEVGSVADGSRLSVDVPSMNWSMGDLPLYTFTHDAKVPTRTEPLVAEDGKELLFPTAFVQNMKMPTNSTVMIPYKLKETNPAKNIYVNWIIKACSKDCN